MMQYKNAEDWVLATGETHTVRQFLEIAFNYLNLNWEDYKNLDKFFQIQ